MKTPETKDPLSENPKCICTDCKCDPCECTGTKCCGKSTTCQSSWCNWGAALRIAIAVGLIVGAFALGLSLGNHKGGDRDGYGRHSGMMEGQQKGKKDKMAEHCQMMPEMMGCEKYQTQSTQMMDMSHDPMMMSMADMGAMLEGKTGDELNKAFLTGMIPHHQGAIDMAKYLAASNKPELVKLGADIITAQQKEIDQMNTWMREWGYTQTGTTSTGTMSTGDTQTGTMNMHMMPDGTMMHN